MSRKRKEKSFGTRWGEREIISNLHYTPFPFLLVSPRDFLHSWNGWLACWRKEKKKKPGRDNKFRLIKRLPGENQGCKNKNAFSLGKPKTIGEGEKIWTKFYFSASTFLCECAGCLGINIPSLSPSRQFATSNLKMKSFLGTEIRSKNHPNFPRSGCRGFILLK